MLETVVSNFPHSSMITPRPLLRIINSVLVLSNESVSEFHRVVKIHALTFRSWRS